MIEPQEVEISNVLSLKKVKSRLNTTSLTFVRGANLDASQATPTNNGAGKSLFFSTIPNVAYFSPPCSLKKKAKRELLGKGSSIKFTFKGNDGCIYAITQTATKYVIEKDGVDIKIRTTPLAEQYIRQVWPLTEIEYYTHGYLSTQRPFLLQSDSDANRLTHFSTIFRLDQHDVLRQFFSTKLRSIKDDEIRLSTLEQKALSLKTNLKKVKSLFDEDALNTSKKELKVLEKEIQALVKEEFEVLKTIQALKTLKTIEKELDELRGNYKSSSHPDKRVVWLKKQRTLVRAVEAYESLLDSYTKTIKTTKAKIDALKLPKKSSNDLTLQVEELSKKKKKLKAQISELEDTKSAYDALVREGKKLSKELLDEHEIDSKSDKVDLDADYSAEIESCRTSLRLEKLLKHDHLDGKCPTCLSDVDIKDIKQVVAKAKRRLPDLEKLVDSQELYRKLLKVKSSLSKVDFDAAELESAEKELKSVEKLLERNSADLAVWEKHETLQQALEAVEKPKKPKEVPETDLSLSELDDEIDLCVNILKHLEAKDRLIHNNEELPKCRTVSEVEQHLKSQEKRKVKLEESLEVKRKASSKITSSIDKQRTLSSEINLYTKELKDSQTQIDKLKPGLADKKVLEVLIKAYSHKGLKTIVANKICALLETNLNYYRDLIFLEPFTFSVHAGDKGLSIKVDRKNGHISDVRNLSGAESNCFRLLFLISLLPLIPNEHRLSMLVLDEPMSHADEVPRKLFLERYLPALQEVVPNIYVITPNESDAVKGADEWVLRKQKGITTLVAVGDMVASTFNKLKAIKTVNSEHQKAKPRKKACTV